MRVSANTDEASDFFLEAFSPECRANPYPLYERMRQRGSVLATDVELHLDFGHAACWSVLRNPFGSSDERRGTAARRDSDSGVVSTELLQQRQSLIFMDPPDHTRIRATVASCFTPRRIASLRHDIETNTARLINDLRHESGAGPVDLVERFAYPLPLTVICGMLGVPLSDYELFHGWSRTMTKGIDPGVLRSEADNVAIANAWGEIGAYTVGLLADLARTPGDNLLSDLVHQHGTAGGLSDAELVDLVILLLVAGHETTVNLIGNGMLALCDNPEQLRMWALDPSIAETGVDELLRYDSPLQMVQRIATTDIDVDGAIVAAGDQVIVVLGAANRDPLVFDNPDRLDVRRANAARHVSFGGGIHHCLGATLARVEGAVAVTQLLRAFPNIERAGDAPLRDTFTLRGRESIPVLLNL